jgi:hypothetical protein
VYHVYEQPGTATAGRLAVLSDDDWRGLTPEQRAGYTLRHGGFRTGLEAVVCMLDLGADPVADRTNPSARCSPRRSPAWLSR